MSNDDDDSFTTPFFAHVDSSLPQYICELMEAVAIPSISSDLPNHLTDIIKMTEWTKSYIEKLGGWAMLLPNPDKVDESGHELPPILLAEFRANEEDWKKKKTVCCYAHLDVQPAAIADGWDSPPFTLTERDGKLYGRGSTDDKGPALSWLWVIQAHRKLGVDLPVNVKLMFEGMEESGSDGMFTAIRQLSKGAGASERDGKGFLTDVDFFCISDNYWLGASKPCLTYGLRGLAFFTVTVQCCEQDLHSGVLGGTVHEAMTDLIHLLATLVDSSGNILIEGIMDDVAPVTEEEEHLYDGIEFDIEAYKKENKIITGGGGEGSDGKARLLKESKKDLLMARWRYPSLSVHGIEGAFSGAGAKTVIPAKVTGKFSLRLVPNQDPQKISTLVQTHLRSHFSKLNSPNKLSISLLHGAHAWKSDPKHPNFEAAAKATEKVYGMKPDYTREGGSIPITTAFEEATKMNVCLLPVGACDDMAHSQNEKYNVKNLVNGVKLLGLYLHELGKFKGPKPSECRCVELTDEELMEPGAFLRGFKCKCVM